MSEIFAKRVFIASAVFIVAVAGFVYGLTVQRYQVWPYAIISAAADAWRSVRQFGAVIPPGRRVVAPPTASRESFTIHDPARIADGYYVFVGWNDEAARYTGWLYDSTGILRHRWPLDYLALDPDGPLNGEDHPHPFFVLEDGSVIVAFDSGDVMARLDSCSEPIWVKSGIYHHALSRDDDGSFWIWRGDGTPYGHYHYIENFDAATGATIDEIGLVEDVIADSDLARIVLGLRSDFAFRRFDRDPVFLAANDLFHTNDVDVLSEDMAAAFPLFEAGDLLLSFRSLNLVAVLDPDDRGLKWWRHGPWRMQHDPDFVSDGTISVFNNNTGRGRSEIIKIDPSTGAARNELQDGSVQFYTDFMGKHQYLPNGNVLIVVPGEGRVVEVTANGDEVMEFNNVAPDSRDFNDHVENGMWVPADYFDAVPACTVSRG